MYFDRDLCKNTKRRKSSQKQEKITPKVADISGLPEKQRGIAEKLQDILAPLITEASDARGYRIPDGQTAKSLATRFIVQICHAAAEHHGEPSGPNSPFAERLRTIMFNVKKNTFLIDRLLSGSLKADELSTMATEEMASEQREALRNQSAQLSAPTETKPAEPQLRDEESESEEEDEDWDDWRFRPA